MLHRLVHDTTLAGLPIIALLLWFSFHFAYICHELGHYTGARLAGIRPLEVVVGHYGTVCDKTIAGTRFVFRALTLPWGDSHTLIGPCKLTRCSALIFILAGIIVNMIIGIILTVIGVHWDSASCLIFAITSLCAGIAQLSPSKGTDGFYAWKVITGCTNIQG